MSYIANISTLASSRILSETVGSIALQVLCSSLATDRFTYSVIARFTNQEDDVYDDVGSPMARVDIDCTCEATSRDSESIYDDVMAPCDATRGPVGHFKQHDRSLAVDNERESKSTIRVCNSEIRGDESSQDEDHYLFVTNTYSSVDDEDIDEMQDDEQGVYDDVGLPSEEKVNSLYAGSTTGSVVGKESEWEDLEDPTIRHSCIARKNNLS